MNKEEYAEKFMPRAKQDIKMCENEHELQEYIAGLLENIDYWQKEYDYMKKDRDTLQQENKQLKEQVDMIYKGKKLKLLSIEKCKNKYCFNYELKSGDSNE